MGQLVEQPIKTLFNGVSRQPHPVRLPNQLEEADNALPSVTTGGFEKRPATTHLKKLDLDSDFDYAIHVIDRDSTERYVVTFGDNTIKVFDGFTGEAKTVNISAQDGTNYLSGDPTAFRAVTVADYTFVVNTLVKVAMAAAGSGTVAGTVQSFSDLPDSPTTGQIERVSNTPDDPTGAYYVKWDGSVWLETVNPNLQNAFDATTMPYQLVRESDGTFTFKKADWKARAVGDNDSVPLPPFVGRTIQDVFFQRNRLGVLADESEFFSQAGDVFNMWPEKAMDVVDTDPIELSASTNKVTILRHAVPFRLSLFATADSQQYEASSGDGPFTPTSATLNPTTAYHVDTMAPPVPMGDQLYFASYAQAAAILYEYYYDGNTYSNVAVDITKHVLGYIPKGIRALASAPSAERLFVLPDSARNHLYCYTSYWDGDNKLQSAWTRFVFGDSEDDAYIHGIAVVADTLYMLIDRSGEVCIETLPVDTEPVDADLGFSVMLDRRLPLTGTYDSDTNTTTWTVPYAHNSVSKVVLGGAFDHRAGRELNVTYPTDTTIAAKGQFDDGDAYIGQNYTLYAEFSKQYVRDGNGASVITGRLQLRYLSLNYKDSGYFEVHVTPYTRRTYVHKMTGRILGDANDRIGVPSIVAAGLFKARIGSRADTVKIAVVNDTFMPCTITAGAWDGFYNNVTQQG